MDKRPNEIRRLHGIIAGRERIALEKARRRPS